MLESSKAEIARETYRVSRMQGKTDLHRDLKSGVTNIELTANLPAFYKIKTIGAVSPCLIRLAKLSSDHNDLQVYVSTIH